MGGKGYKHHIIIAKNPHPGAYTFHDERHKPDLSYLDYEETWCVPLHNIFDHNKQHSTSHVF